jgi:flagellar basal body-associated protein FliL
MKKLFILIILKILSVLLIVVTMVNAFLFSENENEFALSVFLTILSFFLYMGVSLAEIKESENGKI